MAVEAPTWLRVVRHASQHDQAHMISDFKQFTGHATDGLSGPEAARRRGRDR